MDLQTIQAVCLLPKLHPFSAMVLDHYVEGRIDTAEFRRWFHMPNSDYLMLGDCIAQLVDPNYIPEAAIPTTVTLAPPRPKPL